MSAFRPHQIAIAAFIAIASAGAILLFSSSRAQPDQPMENAMVNIGDRQFRVEMAATPAQHQRGLQNRTSLAPDAGMLFILKRVRVAEFWMKDTLIPLDMLFLDVDGRVVKAHLAVPPCRADPCPGYSSEKPVQYVLELAAGQAVDLKPGDRVQLPASLR